MALTLTYTPTVSNDNKVLRITDTTANWGTGGNISISNLNNSTNILYLDISIETTATTVVCDTINLYTTFNGPWTTQAELVFDVTPSIVKVSGSAIDTIFQDGIYTVTYRVNNTSTYTSKFLIYGNVKNTLYNKARELDFNYMSQDENMWQTYNSKVTANLIQQEALLFSLEASGYVARTEDLIENLRTLENLQIHGANTYWK